MVPFSDGGVKIGPVSNCLKTSSAAAFNSGVKSIRSLSVTPCRS
jgi:hypothetical protein